MPLCLVGPQVNVDGKVGVVVQKNPSSNPKFSCSPKVRPIFYCDVCHPLSFICFLPSDIIISSFQNVKVPDVEEYTKSWVWQYSKRLEREMQKNEREERQVEEQRNEEEEEQRVDDTKASKSDSKNDDNKKRRRKRKVSTPLESICCRGVCGGNASCLSQETSSEDGNVRFLHCLNFETDLKCPLWIGHSCATQFNNFKCRICALLDNPPRDFAR